MDRRISRGDRLASEVFAAMACQAAKEIGEEEMSALEGGQVLRGEIPDRACPGPVSVGGEDRE